MSSFNCPKCGTFLYDTPGKGYITGCSHFPLEKSKTPEIPSFIKDLFSIK